MLSRRDGPRDFEEVLEDLSISRRSKSQSDLWTGSKTPTNNGFGIRKDPKSSRALKIRNLTPSRNWDFRGPTEGDRYIPQHDEDQMEFARYKFTEEIMNLNRSSSAPTTPAKLAADRLLRATKPFRDIPESAIIENPMNVVDMFVYRRHGAPKVIGQKHNHIIYNCMAPSSSVKRDKRVHCKRPVHILDAPGLTDDYYLNPLDWGSNNIVAIGLDKSVYLWNALTGTSSLFVDFTPESSQIDEKKVCSVRFTNDANYLAVGLSSGFVHLYDLTKQTLVRKVGAGRYRIAAAAWSKNGILSFGNKFGVLQNHDVRQRLSFLSEYNDHNQEICGLEWVCNDNFLISGGNDTRVNIYAAADVPVQDKTPLYQKSDHMASVKAIREVPFMGENVVATGGGMNDHSVKFWDLSNGELLLSHDTGSQISGINFDRYYREMTTSHGVPQNVVTTWKYSSKGMQNAEFTAVNHLEQTSRVLSMSQSPCGSYVIVGTEEECVAIYDVYKKDETYLKALSALKKREAELKFAGVRQRIR